MRASPLLLSLVLMASAPAAAQPAGPQTGLRGLDAETTRILVEAGQKANTETFDILLRGARDEKLAALEKDPVDWAMLVRAIETEKALNILSINRQLDAELEAFARMTPAQRKAVAASSRKLRQTIPEMQARSGN
ncbi:MAG: hypothetical protein SNJ79_11220 [Sphingomonadaceae bacterium]